MNDVIADTPSNLSDDLTPMLKAEILVALARAATRRQIMKERLAELRGLRREMSSQVLAAKIKIKSNVNGSRARKEENRKAS